MEGEEKGVVVVRASQSGSGGGGVGGGTAPLEHNFVEKYNCRFTLADDNDDDVDNEWLMIMWRRRRRKRAVVEMKVSNVTHLLKTWAFQSRHPTLPAWPPMVRISLLWFTSQICGNKQQGQLSGQRTRLVIERTQVHIPVGAFSSPGSTFCADS